MNYKELRTSKFSGFSVGIINNQYVLSIPMGFCDVPEYFPIIVDEFETFNDWQENVNKIYEIEARKPLK